MKILIVNDNISRYGGTEESIRNIKGLLEEHGNKVKLFGTEKRNTFLSFISRWFSIRYYFKIRNSIKEFNPDVIHFNNLSRMLSPSVLLAAKHMNKPVIFNFRDFSFYCVKGWAVRKDGMLCSGLSFNCIFECKGGENFIYDFMKWFKKKWQRLLIKKYTDHYIATSSALFKAMKKDMSLKENEISLIPNFLTNIKFNKCNVTTKKNQFLYVGRLSEEKGVDVSITAINIMVHKQGIKDIVFKIAGKGPDELRLKNLVKKLKLDKNIEFLGYVDHDRLNCLYQESAALIVPSVWREAFGRVCLEAMKNKTPIIASDIGGLSNLIINEKNGLLFEPGNAPQLSKKIYDIYKSKDKQRMYGDKAYYFLINNLNKNKQYKKLINVYNSVYK
jgi:glycosyltransferase involved in cell wall biosynthesis